MPEGLTLVTGATGFVGSHVAEALVAAGHRIRCTVRASSDLRWLEGLEAELEEADLAASWDPEAVLDGVGLVVHVAGVTRAPRPELYRRVNVEATERLARAAREAGVERFVFVSSLAARGPDGARGPVSEYGRSKREAEERLRRLVGVAIEEAERAEAGGGNRPPDPPGTAPDPGGRGPSESAQDGRMEVVVLRPAGVYGPRDTDLLPLFRSAARGWMPVPTGELLLQPVYVEDVARSVVRAADVDAGFGPWPVAEEGRYRWPEVAQRMEAAVGRKVRSVPVPPAVVVGVGAVAEGLARLTGRPPAFDRRRARDLSRNQWTCDPAPTRDALGWSPRHPLPGGLRRTSSWYREAGWL